MQYRVKDRLNNEYEIKESSIFTINGQVELRVEPVLSSKIVAKT